MRFLVLGAGGIGSYFGARLIEAGYSVTFVARDEHLEALKQNGLKLHHLDFNFENRVLCYSFDELKNIDADSFDAILLATKSTSTEALSKDLKNWFGNSKKTPYIVSLQNGVENEEKLSKDIDESYIIAGLTRKIGAHIVKPSYIEAKGTAETILGTLNKTAENQAFLEEITDIFNKAKIPTQISKDIKLELWKKLIINNGVNAICALLKEETSVITKNEKLSKIVYGLMSETAQAALNKGINISKQDVDEMFELIKNKDNF